MLLVYFSKGFYMSEPLLADHALAIDEALKTKSNLGACYLNALGLLLLTNSDVDSYLTKYKLAHLVAHFEHDDIEPLIKLFVGKLMESAQISLTESAIAAAAISKLSKH